MIADCDTNVVFVADTLVRRFPKIYAGLQAMLAEHGIPLVAIQGTQDVWCRDYLPIQIANDRFVKFRYAPDYLAGDYEHLRADSELGPKLAIVKTCERSEIVLDGGNVVGWKNQAIMTDKIYRENTAIGRRELRERLTDLLQIEILIVVPKEPFDPIGHADGMVRWLDKRRVVLNDYTVVGEPYRTRVRRRLDQSQLEIIEIPYCPPPQTRGGIPSAVGTWINFLRVGKLIVVPTFGIEGDQFVLRMLRECCPDLIVESLDSRELAREGGVINCVTWPVLCREHDIDSAFSVGVRRGRLPVVPGFDNPAAGP